MRNSLFGIGLLCTLLAGCGGGAPAAAIRPGLSQAGVGYGPFFAAKDAGFFSNNGLDVTIQQVNGPAAVPALMADEVQVDALAPMSSAGRSWAARR